MGEGWGGVGGGGVGGVGEGWRGEGWVGAGRGLEWMLRHVRGQGKGEVEWAGVQRYLKQRSLALDRRGHEFFCSTLTLGTFAPAAPAPLPPILPRIRILLASVIRSPRLDLLKKSPKLSSRAKCTRHLARDSAVSGISSPNWILRASPGLTHPLGPPSRRSAARQALNNSRERGAEAKAGKREEPRGPDIAIRSPPGME